MNHKDLEKQLVEAKLAQATLLMTEEKETHLKERETVSHIIALLLWLLVIAECKQIYMLQVRLESDQRRLQVVRRNICFFITGNWFTETKMTLLRPVGLKQVLEYSDLGRFQTSAGHFRATRVLCIYIDKFKETKFPIILTFFFLWWKTYNH